MDESVIFWKENFKQTIARITRQTQFEQTWKPYILYDIKTVECTHYIMVDREACIKSCFMTIMTVGETNLRLPGLSKINFLDKKTKNLFVARMVPELWL